MKKGREDTGIPEVLLEKARELSGFSGHITVSALFGDGSDRRFFRIGCGKSTYIALVSERTRKNSTDENDSYLNIGRHLRLRGIPAPLILYADARRGRFLLEDAGDLHLQAFVRRNPANLEKIYRRVLLLLVSMHRKAPPGFLPEFCFDTPVYDAAFIFERELEYFRKNFAVRFLGMPEDGDMLRHDFENLAQEAAVRAMRFVFHRDFQSRNIMVRGQNLWLLDFQGMRFGPPAYDLASMLVDPYVRLPRRLQERLAGLYWSGAGKFLGCSRSDFIRDYTAVRLCRNLQILGAFGFLGLVKGKTHFLDYVPWAWAQLREWLHSNCRGRYPDLEKLVLRPDANWRGGLKRREI